MTDENHVPPYTNRGAQNTNESGLIACVDWVQVTFLHAESPHDIITLLGLEFEDFSLIDTGKYGYRFQLRYGHIVIYYSDDSIGCHLEITGQGCREYESYNKYEWSVLFGLFLMLPVSFSRLDLAIDDYKGYFKITTLYRKLKSGHARSKFKKFRYMVESYIAKKEITGQTVYLGSPTSKLMIRFYDKLAERKNKNYEIVDGLTCWNRTEFQLRDQRADTAAILISTEKYNLGEMISSLLKNYINFVNPKKLKDGSIDSNKGRWDVADFWLKFLGDVDKLTLSEKAPDQTIEKVKSWYDKNMTGTMSMLFEAFDNNPTLIAEWLNQGKDKRSKKHENMLLLFKKEKEKLENQKQEKKISLLGKKFEVNENGQLVPIVKKIKKEEIIKEVIEVDKIDFDKELAELLKDKYIFKIKKDQNQLKENGSDQTD